jgi:hypothetical protein
MLELGQGSEGVNFWVETEVLVGCGWFRVVAAVPAAEG